MPVVSRLFSVVLRVAEIAFGAVVAGIIGYFLHQFDEADSWPKARWIYTEVVAGISIFLGVIWLIPFSSGFFSWPFDVVISLAWFAAFGILVDAIHDLGCGSIWHWGGILNDSTCGRWKAAEAFSFLSAIVWLASALLGIWFTYRVRGTTTDRHCTRFISLSRQSFDPTPADGEQSTSEPLLPTSTFDHRHVRAPEHFSCSISGILGWAKGPSPPRKYHITPWLARWQTAPSHLIDRYFPNTKIKLCLLLACLGLWGVVFVSTVHSTVASQQIPGHGSPVKLSCWSRLWSNGTNCGLNGDYCRPFDGESFAFRCPAGCASFEVLEPYFIGPQEINYRTLVIGGPSDGHELGVYRGDSAICQAAIHAGLLDDQKGGCGVLRRTGEYADFPAKEKNGMSSIEFPSYFPLSFTFDAGESPDENNLQCQDLRWPLFAFSVVVSALLSLVITSPAAFFASVFFIVYFQVALSSDPPPSPNYYEVVSTALGRFLPCAFVGFAIYYFCVRHTLKDLEAHWDKTVLWLGPCWVAALNKDTFDKIPISRLTPHDIQQQPGAIPALIIIILVLCAVVVGQVFAFRNEGKLPKMLVVYGVLVSGVVALLVVPNMNLRIHHYILSLLFLPGTTVRTRPSLLYQGLLMGLFINGIARWGFDSILQTSAALLDGAQLGSLLPDVGVPDIPSPQKISFSFPDLPQEMYGISVLVNDVERFHDFKSEAGTVDVFNWTRGVADKPEYFRFGYIKENALGGIWYEDFTKPATWDVDGKWNQTKSD